MLKKIIIGIMLCVLSFNLIGCTEDDIINTAKFVAENSDDVKEKFRTTNVNNLQDESTTIDNELIDMTTDFVGDVITDNVNIQGTLNNINQLYDDDFAILHTAIETYNKNQIPWQLSKIFYDAYLNGEVNTVDFKFYTKFATNDDCTNVSILNSDIFNIYMIGDSNTSGYNDDAALNNMFIYQLVPKCEGTAYLYSHAINGLETYIFKITNFSDGSMNVCALSGENFDIMFDEFTNLEYNNASLLNIWNDNIIYPN